MGNPFPLKQNAKKSFQGSIVLGKGFVLTPEEAEKLIAKDPRNKDVLFPYLNGDDLNNDPEQKPSRWVINFFDWSEEKARTYPDCFEIIERLVMPERMKQDDKGGKEKWWQFLRPRNELYKTISKLDHVMVIPRVTKYPSMSFVNSKQIFHDKNVVLSYERHWEFLVLQSTIHDEWAKKYSSTLGGLSNLNYSPSECLETFAFPQNLLPDIKERLEKLGIAYHLHRSQLMSTLQLGLTKTYNLFHCNGIVPQNTPSKNKQVLALQKHLEKMKIAISFDETIKSISKLHELHIQMDEAVLDAYGWNDIVLLHDFYEIDYLPENDRIRFTIHPTARKEILKRLLELNHQIFKMESESTSTIGKRLSKRTKADEDNSNTLF
jgi:hypothetical protein